MSLSTGVYKKGWNMNVKKHTTRYVKIQ